MALTFLTTAPALLLRGMEIVVAEVLLFASFLVVFLAFGRSISYFQVLPGVAPVPAAVAR
jgi:hypothetical protein